MLTESRNDFGEAIIVFSSHVLVSKGKFNCRPLVLDISINKEALIYSIAILFCFEVLDIDCHR